MPGDLLTAQAVTERPILPPSDLPGAGSFEADNLTQSAETEPWGVSLEGDIQVDGRWVQGIASDIRPDSDGTLTWEVNTQQALDLRELPTPNDYFQDQVEAPSVIYVQGEVAVSATAIDSEGDVLTPISAPPVREGTEIVAARINNASDVSNSSSVPRSTDKLYIINQATGMQQLAVPAEELDQILDEKPGALHVEVWLAESHQAPWPEASSPVTVSREELSEEMRAEIDSAWDEYAEAELGEPLPEDPDARFVAQQKILDGFEQVLEPVPEDVIIDDPADLVVTILNEQATSDASTTTALVVSNPGLNAVSGYCNTDDSPNLSTDEQCSWPVDADGRMVAVSHESELPDFAEVFEARETSEGDAVAIAPSEEKDPNFAPDLEGTVGLALLGTATLAALIARARSGRRRHIRQAGLESPKGLDAADPFEALDITDEKLNKAHQTLMHHLWGGDLPAPSRPSTLSRAEIVASLTQNGMGPDVITSLEAAPGFSDNPDLQLAHQLVVTHVLQAEPSKS